MPTKPVKSQNFNESFQELEKIVEDLESNKVDLEESLAKFERGLELAEQCKKRLSEVENKVVSIKKKFGVGVTEDIDE